MNRWRRTVLGLTLSLALGAAMAPLAPQATLAAEPTFGQPMASAALGEPIVFTSTITGDDIAAVEVIVRLVGDETNIVLPARPAEPTNTWQVTQEIDIATSALCECVAEIHGAPNTRFEFQFRVRGADGATTLGPIGQGIVSDDRFEWRTVEQDLVRVHWYNGGDAFAQNAASVANEAIDRAAELLGTTLPQPVDLFVYDTQQALLEAVSPNRENIAGQAHNTIDTMFVWIPPDEGADAFAGEVVRHELTHLVFDAATDNPYHSPPLWLNEGVAVYLSVGYSSFYQSFVDEAVADRTLIPLDGLTGLFPSPPDQFFLAYGEAVAAVDFFIRTHGEENLWALVRSYADGLTDDQAFVQATGADAAAFNAAWFASLGLEVPQPFGPQPGPTGPLPPDWQGGPQTPQPTASAGASASPASPPASASARPSPSTPAPTPSAPPAGPGTSDDSGRLLLIGLSVIVVAVLVVIVGVLLAQPSRARRPPYG